MAEQAYKRCSKCGETKPLGEFSRNRREKDGRGGWCKVCHLAQKHANPERVAAHNRHHNERHPEKARARQAVRDAVYRGKLTKPDRCEGCGELTEPRLLQGHHADYFKPLEVEWLCRSCHEGRHHG